MAAVTLASLLSCAPELNVQLLLLMLQSFWWWWFIQWSPKAIIAPFIKPKPWAKQWTQLNRKGIKEGMFVEFPNDEEAFDFSCGFIAILIQHFVGGLFCLPSVLGGRHASVCAMACHGALCEAGWELQDIVSRAWQVCQGHPSDKAKNPTPWLVLLAIHHVMGQAMIVPMNIYYHDNSDYHEFVFLLQFAAFLSMMLTNYGYTLNVETASGLRTMRMTVATSWLIVCYSRVVRYCIVGMRLSRRFYLDGRIMLFYIGSASLLLMSLVNLLIFADSTRKLVKFVLKTSATAEEVVDAAVEVNSALNRAHSGPLVRSSQKNWAKLRSVVLLGAMSPASKSKSSPISASGDEHPAHAESLRQRSCQ
eukprot:TRINITY_DN48341_c0_g1_i1.p1 TRINITY_DN48341_c0_g1~~TRINITY_DN48341_c0_g1_i1.p1  ORF type:complete len:363 (-),score=61.15 TRINITY_DN48341_c0_g1_i1:429-1517(-)